MIRITSLTVRFGQTTVLRDISLEIPKGQTIAIMGASGGGKTTLLRCMSGLLRPTEGSVEVLGVNLNSASERDMDAVRLKMGVVFQGAALFDYLNVRDNVAFGVCRHRRLSVQELNTLVSDKLSLVGLEGSEGFMPSELSGGMRKRVGLARALATDPEILYYDEPTSGLDPITAYSIDALIKDVGAKLGTTSVIVTHDLHSVMRVSQRVVFLYEGSIIEDGAPEQFLNSKDPRIREIIDKSEATIISAT